MRPVGGSEHGPLVTAYPAADRAARLTAARVLRWSTLASPAGWITAAAGLLVGIALIRAATGAMPGLLVLTILVLGAPMLSWLGWWAGTALTPAPRGGQWWIAHDPACGTAVLATSPPDAGGRVKISSFGANPRRTGLGTLLVKTVIEGQHQQGRAVHGTAFRGVATKYYRDRLGFTAIPVRGTLDCYWTISSQKGRPGDLSDQNSGG